PDPTPQTNRETSGRQPAADRSRAEGSRDRVCQAGGDRSAQGPRALDRVRARRGTPHGHRLLVPRDRPAPRTAGKSRMGGARQLVVGAVRDSGGRAGDRGCTRVDRPFACIAQAPEEQDTMSKPAAVVDRKITRDDIEAKLQELRGEVDQRAEAAK